MENTRKNRTEFIHNLMKNETQLLEHINEIMETGNYNVYYVLNAMELVAYESRLIHEHMENIY